MRLTWTVLGTLAILLALLGAYVAAVIAVMAAAAGIGIALRWGFDRARRERR